MTEHPQPDVERPFLDLVERHWRRVFKFAVRVTLSEEDAATVTEEVFLRAYVGQSQLPAADRIEAWLLKIAGHILVNRLPRRPPVSFEILDETLRSDATRNDGVASLTQPQREYLLWELRQACLTAVVNCLSPGERAAFVLGVMMGYTDGDAAQTLGVKLAALKVRLSRARKKVSEYLAPRCEHVNPLNPCHCPSRLGIALDRGFIGPPPSAEAILRKPPLAGLGDRLAARHDPLAVYPLLPDPAPPYDLVERLRSQIVSGHWRRLRAGGGPRA